MPHTTEVANLLAAHFSNTTVPRLIAVGGPGGTGKSVFAIRLAEAIGEATVLKLDDYKQSRRVREERGVFGPHPRANKMDLIRQHLSEIASGNSFEKPVYRSEVGDADRTEPYHPSRYNLIDGEVSTYPKFKDYIDFAIYIDSDWKTQLMRRAVRDVEERGHSPEKVLTTFLNSNLREFPQFGEPTKADADLLLYCDEETGIRIVEHRDRASGVIRNEFR